jgi:hypothetical protein
MTDRVAHAFLLQGIQHWGQTAEQRERATRAYVEAAGLKFGSNEANEWLEVVLKNLRRGKFETEVEYLQSAIELQLEGAKQVAAERKQS